MLCPCGSNLKLSECCQPFISGTKNAPTAEKLMRSRYTAYTIAHIDYLLKSHHKCTRPIKERKAILRWAKSVKWMSLSILNKENGEAEHDKGMIEFRALYIENGVPQHIHEKSLFRKEKGMWYYVSGTHFQ